MIEAAEIAEGFKMTEIGQLPEDWEVMKLGDVCERPQYGFTASAVENQIGPLSYYV